MNQFIEIQKYQLSPFLIIAQLLLLLFIVYCFLPRSACLVDSSSQYAIEPDSCSPNSTVAFVSIILSSASFVMYYLTSSTLRLSAHWRHLILISATLSILCIHIILLGLGRGYIIHTDMRYYFGAIIAYIMIHTWIFSFMLFPLRKPSVSPNCPNIATHTFMIPMTIPPQTPHLMYKSQPSYELTVQIWYASAAPSSAVPATTWTSGNPATQDAESMALMNAILGGLHLPSFLLQHHALRVESNPLIFYSSDLPSAPETSPLQPSSRPIAIYSHGMYSWRQLSTSTIIELVSQGFVVFAADHSPSAYVTRPPGPDKFSKFDFHVPPNLTLADEREFYTNGLERRVWEVQRLVDFLHSEDAASIRSFCSPSKLHMYGHSFGAATVAAVCARDARVVSAVLLDSWMFPVPDMNLRSGSLHARVLSIASSEWGIGRKQVGFRRQYCAATQQKLGLDGGFVLKIAGSDHQNFCDIFSLATSVVLNGMIGTVDPFALCDSLNSTICKFFIRCQQEHNTAIQASISDSHMPSLEGSTRAEDHSRCEYERFKRFLQPDLLSDALLDRVCVDDELGDLDCISVELHSESAAQV